MQELSDLENEVEKLKAMIAEPVSKEWFKSKKYPDLFISEQEQETYGN